MLNDPGLCFRIVMLEKILRGPCTARRSSQSSLKEINLEYSLEGLMLKPKLQYFGHLMGRADSLEDSEVGKDWRQKNVETEDEMVGLHHWLNEHKFKQTLGDSDGQGAWCAAVHGVAKSYTTQLNNNNLIIRSNQLSSDLIKKKVLWLKVS